MNYDLSVPAALVSERMGLYYPQDRWPDLARGLEKAAATLGFATMQSFINHLLAGEFGQREIEALAIHLTIGETHFFRNPDLFAKLESWLLPELIAERQSTRSLRLWSAGCATGQEPYSLAILVSRLITKLDSWDITILATDINPEAFNAAKAGEYTQWSFRGTPAWAINGYFSKLSDGRYCIDQSIRDMVTFRYLNLADDSYPSPATGLADFDLILCRNVVMYFAPEVVKKVGDRLHRSLREGGYLVVTPSEASRDMQCGMTSMLTGGEVVYKKTSAAEQASSDARVRHSKPAVRHGQPPLHAAGRGDHRMTQRSGRERVPALRPTPDSSPDAGTGSWPEVDRRKENRPFAAYAKRKAAAEAEMKTKKGPKRSAPRLDAEQAAREARLLANKGECKKALELCDTALENDKLNPSLYYLKASILQELGRHDEAERALQSTLFLDANFALARVMLGAIARGQARWGEAVKHFAAALSQLEQMPPDYVLPETDGLTAGQMAETVASLMGSECAL